MLVPSEGQRRGKTRPLQALAACFRSRLTRKKAKGAHSLEKGELQSASNMHGLPREKDRSLLGIVAIYGKPFKGAKVLDPNE